MANFLTRLVDRTRGVADAVWPVLPSKFEQWSFTSPPVASSSERETEQGACSEAVQDNTRGMPATQTWRERRIVVQGTDPVDQSDRSVGAALVPFSKEGMTDSKQPEASRETVLDDAPASLASQEQIANGIIRGNANREIEHNREQGISSETVQRHAVFDHKSGLGHSQVGRAHGESPGHQGAPLGPEAGRQQSAPAVVLSERHAVKLPSVAPSSAVEATPAPRQSSSLIEHDRVIHPSVSIAPRNEETTRDRSPFDKSISPDRFSQRTSLSPESDGKQADGQHSPPGSPGTSGPGAVKVTIGRIEVQAIMQQPPAPVRSSPATPKISLDEYLKRQNEAKR